MAHSPLISAEELQRQLTDPHLVIIDVRGNISDRKAGRAAYDAGHIPGARFADMETDVSGCRSGTNGRHPLPDSGRFCVNMRRLGVSPDCRIVVYDDGMLTFGARLWFTLRWVGFEHVRILNGGFAAWQKAGYEVQTEMPEWEGGTYRAQQPLEHTFGVEFIEKNLEDSHYVLLDARSHDRFLGQNEHVDPVAGHIPGAINRPCSENIGPDGLMKPAEQLKEEFVLLLRRRNGSSVINMCGSGITACNNHLAMMVAGLPAAGVYIGSWSEWISDENRPVSTQEFY